MHNNTDRETVKCSNCGKKQVSQSKYIVFDCELCGEHHPTDYARGLGERDPKPNPRDHKHLDPIDVEVNSEAYRRTLIDHTDFTAERTASQGGHPSEPDFIEKVVVGMNAAFFIITPAVMSVLGYWGLMITPMTDPDPTPLNVAIQLSTLLLILVGGMIMVTSTMYVLGDLAHRLSTRGEDDD